MQDFEILLTRWQAKSGPTEIIVTVDQVCVYLHQWYLCYNLSWKLSKLAAPNI